MKKERYFGVLDMSFYMSVVVHVLRVIPTNKQVTQPNSTILLFHNKLKLNVINIHHFLLTVYVLGESIFLKIRPAVKPNSIHGSLLRMKPQR